MGNIPFLGIFFHPLRFYRQSQTHEEPKLIENFHS
jgi:hypothetical protein